MSSQEMTIFQQMSATNHMETVLNGVAQIQIFFFIYSYNTHIYMRRAGRVASLFTSMLLLQGQGDLTPGLVPTNLHIMLCDTPQPYVFFDLKHFDLRYTNRMNNANKKPPMARRLMPATVCAFRPGELLEGVELPGVGAGEG